MSYQLGLCTDVWFTIFRHLSCQDLTTFSQINRYANAVSISYIEHVFTSFVKQLQGHLPQDSPANPLLDRSLENLSSYTRIWRSFSRIYDEILMELQPDVIYALHLYDQIEVTNNRALQRFVPHLFKETASAICPLYNMVTMPDSTVYYDTLYKVFYDHGQASACVRSFCNTQQPLQTLFALLHQEDKDKALLQHLLSTAHSYSARETLFKFLMSNASVIEQALTMSIDQKFNEQQCREICALISEYERDSEMGLGMIIDLLKAWTSQDVDIEAVLVEEITTLLFHPQDVRDLVNRLPIAKAVTLIENCCARRPTIGEESVRRLIYTRESTVEELIERFVYICERLDSRCLVECCLMGLQLMQQHKIAASQAVWLNPDLLKAIYMYADYEFNSLTKRQELLERILSLEATLLESYKLANTVFEFIRQDRHPAPVLLTLCRTYPQRVSQLSYNELKAIVKTIFQYEFQESIEVFNVLYPICEGRYKSEKTMHIIEDSLRQLPESLQRARYYIHFFMQQDASSQPYTRIILSDMFPSIFRYQLFDEGCSIVDRLVSAKAFKAIADIVTHVTLMGENYLIHAFKFLLLLPDSFEYDLARRYEDLAVRAFLCDNQDLAEKIVAKIDELSAKKHYSYTYILADLALFLSRTKQEKHIRTATRLCMGLPYTPKETLRTIAIEAYANNCIEEGQHIIRIMIRRQDWDAVRSFIKGLLKTNPHFVEMMWELWKMHSGKIPYEALKYIGRSAAQQGRLDLVVSILEAYPSTADIYNLMEIISAVDRYMLTTQVINIDIEDPQITRGMLLIQACILIDGNKDSEQLKRILHFLSGKDGSSMLLEVVLGKLLMQTPECQMIAVNYIRSISGPVFGSCIQPAVIAAVKFGSYDDVLSIFKKTNEWEARECMLQLLSERGNENIVGDIGEWWVKSLPLNPFSSGCIEDIIQESFRHDGYSVVGSRMMDAFIKRIKSVDDFYIQGFISRFAAMKLQESSKFS